MDCGILFVLPWPIVTTYVGCAKRRYSYEISLWDFMRFGRCVIFYWGFMPFGSFPKHGCFKIVGGFFRRLSLRSLLKDSACISCLSLVHLYAFCCTFYVWDFLTGFSCFFGAVMRFLYEVTCFWLLNLRRGLGRMGWRNICREGGDSSRLWVKLAFCSCHYAISLCDFVCLAS